MKAWKVLVLIAAIFSGVLHGCDQEEEDAPMAKDDGDGDHDDHGHSHSDNDTVMKRTTTFTATPSTTAVPTTDHGDEEDHGHSHRWSKGNAEGNGHLDGHWV